MINIPTFTQLRALALLWIHQFAFTLFLDYNWKYHDDLCGSGTILYITKNIASAFVEATEKWQLNQTDWPSFKAICESKINEIISKTKDPIDNFTTILYDIATETIAKTSTKKARKKRLGLTMIVK